MLPIIVLVILLALIYLYSKKEGFGTNRGSSCCDRGWIKPSSNLNTLLLNYSVFNPVSSNDVFESIYDGTYKAGPDAQLQFLPRTGPLWTPKDVVNMQRDVWNNGICGQ